MRTKAEVVQEIEKVEERIKKLILSMEAISRDADNTLNEDDRILKMALVFEDQKEKKQLEIELRRLVKELRKAKE